MAEEPKVPPPERLPSPGASPPSEAAEGPPATSPKEDWETRFKYLFADFENFRKRVGRENDRARDRARAELLRALLPLYEAFEKAREATRRLPEKDPVRRGLELLDQEWEAFLVGEGVEPVARVGGTFQSELHEAVAETPVTNEHPVGTVVEVVQQGYAFPGGLLRPAKVVVARPPASHQVPGSAPSSPEEPGTDPSG